MKFAQVTLTTVIFWLYSTFAYSQAPQRVPATPYPIQKIQPDGDTITIRLFGDEWHHYHTTLDGYVIVENKAGYFCYGKLDANGKVVASKHRVSSNPKINRCTKQYLKRIENNPKLKKRIN